MLLGQTVSAVDGAAAAGLSVRVGSGGSVTTDASGYFQTDVGGPGNYATIVAGSTIVERHTTVSGPTTERARLSLIPISFDLQAFDEMMRTANARLQRWTTKPSLVVIAAVMPFHGFSDTDFNATGEQMSEDEAALMIAHFTQALALHSGGTYTSFASVEVERPASGTHVSVARPGKIVVGRYSGVMSLGNTIGYGRWYEQSDGSVNGGSVFLDREFDRDQERRRLLRYHELGHAMGYLHVTSRTSIMNPSIGPEPTDFDRAASVIAFQRPPGNQSPDTDPGSSSGSSPFGVVTGISGHWSDPIE